MRRPEPPAIIETTAIVYRLADIQERQQEWIWQGYIPKGCFSIGYGDPNAGKTTAACHLSARITSGQDWPDGQPNPKPRSVLFLTGEDSVSRTLLPRFRAAGGDVNKLVVWDRVRFNYEDGEKSERLPDLLADVGKLKDIITSCPDMALVVVDTLSCFLAVKDSNQAQQVRAALLPLRDLCEQTGVTLLGLGHMNKSSGQKAQYRASGSISYIGAARSALLFTPDRDDPETMVMAVSKCNLARRAPSLKYRIVPWNKDPEVAAVEWCGTSSYSADQLLEEQKVNTKKKAIIEWLKTILKDGPLLSDTIMRMAAEEGFKERTVWNAKDDAGVKARKQSFSGPWEWYIP